MLPLWLVQHWPTATQALNKITGSGPKAGTIGCVLSCRDSKSCATSLIGSGMKVNRSVMVVIGILALVLSSKSNSCHLSSAQPLLLSSLLSVKNKNNNKQNETSRGDWIMKLMNQLHLLESCLFVFDYFDKWYRLEQHSHHLKTFSTVWYSSIPVPAKSCWVFLGQRLHEWEKGAAFLTLYRRLPQKLPLEREFFF